MSLSISNPAPSTPPPAPPAPAASAPKGPPPAAAPPTPRRRVLLAIGERLLIALAIGGSFVVIYWSMGRLRTVQNESRSLAQQATRLQGEIAMMRANWPEDAITNTVRRHAAATNQLFSSVGAVEEWRDALATRAVPLALEVAVEFEGARQERTGASAVTVMQAEVSMSPGPVPGAQSIYRRLVPLVSALTDQAARSDLTGLTVEGGTNSILRSTATVELWTVDQTAPTP